MQGWDLLLVCHEIADLPRGCRPGSQAPSSREAGRPYQLLKNHVCVISEKANKLGYLSSLPKASNNLNKSAIICPKAQALTMSSSLSAVRFRARYRFSSADDSSPVSSFSCCSFWSSGMLEARGMSNYAPGSHRADPPSPAARYLTPTYPCS